jgi:transposase-like protein
VLKLDQAEADVLAYMSFPLTHRPKLHSTIPIERLNSEIKRRTDVSAVEVMSAHPVMSPRDWLRQ